MKQPFRIFTCSLIASVAGAVALGAASFADAQELTTVQILTANDTSCGLYPQHAGRELGSFAQNGVEVKLLSAATTIPYVAFLSNGDADYVMLDSAQVLQMANADQPGSVIYEVYQYAPDLMIVLADSPIEGLADLKGKTIGLASDRDQITAIVALDTVGVDISEVQTAVVGDSGPLLATSLENGRIDALAGSTADWAGIQAAGVAVRNITPPEVNENVGNSWAVWDPRKEELHDATIGFLRGWAMAQAAGVIDTKMLGALCRKVLPEQWEVESIGWELIEGTVYQRSLRRTIKFGELQPDVWQRVQPALLKMGEIDELIPVEEFLDPQYIDEANNFTTPQVKELIAKWKEENEDVLFN